MPFELAILGIAIGANNLAASLALGALDQKAKRWRVVGVFATFEFLVPLCGMWIGRRVAGVIASYTYWLSPALIAAVGAWTIFAMLRRDINQEALARRVTSWGGIVVLALTLSVDNLVIGFSLGLGEQNPLQIATTIAVFSAAFAWSGFHIGHVVRRNWEKPAELGSGLLLLGLAWAMAAGWI